MSSGNCAVFLLGFGGPDGLDAIEPFLRNVMNGRTPSKEVVETIKERYRLIGGASPLLDITRRQAQALEIRLNQSNEKTFRVFVGMRFWSPYIKDVLQEICKAGIEKIIAVSMSPYRSDFVESGYKREIDEWLNIIGKKVKLKLVSEWYYNPSLHRIVAQRIKDGVSCFNNEEAVVIFSAHSLPLKFMPVNDPYAEQIKKTVESVLALTGTLNWRLGYQSKGNIPGDWLEPSVDSILEKLSEDGVKNVMIVPIGFISDHVETLYDIDILYRKKAESLKLNFNRTPSLNDSDGLIEALYETVMEHKKEI